MLETIRQHAAEQIPASELAALEALFLDYYAGVVEPLARSRTTWEHPRWFTAEIANLRAALDLLEQRQDGERFGWLVCGLVPWWDWQALFTEGLSRCETALTVGGLSDPLRAELLQRAGQCAGYLGDPRTRHFAEQARKMFRQLGDTRGESLCLQELAFLAKTADFADAERLLCKALKLAIEEGDPDHLAITRLHLAQIRIKQGQLDAMEDMRLQVDYFRSRRVPGLSALALSSLAEAELRRGDAAAATSCAREALLSDVWDAPTTALVLLMMLASAESQRGHQTRATVWLGACESIAHAWGVPDSAVGRLDAGS